MKRLLQSNSVVLLDQLVYSGASFATNIALARLLSAGDFGVFSGYVLGIHLLIGVTGAFVIQPFQLLYANVEDVKRYSAFAFWFQVAWVLLMLGMVKVGLWLAGISIPNLVFPFAAGAIIHDFGRKALLAKNKPMATLLTDAALGAVQVGVFVLLYTSVHTTVVEVCGYLAVAYAATALILAFLMHPLLIHVNRSLCFARMHFKQGKWFFMTAIVQWWSANMFVVASGIYLGSAALGAFRITQSLMGVLNMLLQTFENYILPQTMMRMKAGVESGVAYMVTVCRKAMIVIAPVLLLVYFFAARIIVLAGGEQYAPYTFALQGLVLLYVLIVISQPIRIMMRVLLLSQHYFYGYLISFVFALTCSHYLIDVFGLTGVIIGLGISQVLMMIYWSLILQYKSLSLWKSFMSF